MRSDLQLAALAPFADDVWLGRVGALRCERGGGLAGEEGERGPCDCAAGGHVLLRSVLLTCRVVCVARHTASCLHMSGASERVQQWVLTSLDVSIAGKELSKPLISWEPAVAWPPKSPPS